MTASTSSDGEPVEFTTAREFFEGDEERDRAGPNGAKGVIWYDQETPIFYCCACNQHVQTLRFEGETFDVDDFEQRREEARRHLFEHGPKCDLCSGNVPEKVDL